MAYRFRDRAHAGALLGEAVRERAFDRPVVLGIPRGGVPVALAVARRVGGELGVIVARKLGAPGQPELAIGAVAADGSSYLDEEIAQLTGASRDYIERVTTRESAEARRREMLFDGLTQPALAGRCVIVVDDGLATGSTAIAALRSVRAAGAGRVVLAVPIGPPETLARLGAEADEILCLQVEPAFFAVGQAYADFEPVADETVTEILARYRRERTPASPSP